MFRLIQRYLLLCAVVSLVVVPPDQPQRTTTEESATTRVNRADDADRAQLIENFGRLPLSFAAAPDRAGDACEFVARGMGFTLLLAPAEATFVLGGGEDAPAAPPLHMRFVGAEAGAELTGLGQLEGKVNYYLGSDPGQWSIGLPMWTKVKGEGIYPGIDVVYYGNPGELEYDLVVAPGADPGRIEIAFDGAEGVEVADDNCLRVCASGGEVILRAPVIYQEVAGARRSVAGEYVINGGDRVGFELAAYDAAVPLIVDPVVEYATYLGGFAQERCFGVAVDATGHAYVTGYTHSTDFPTQDPLQGSNNGYADAYVAKLNPQGTALLYCTYLGGAYNERGLRGNIALDPAGNIYVAGQTESSDYPTTAGAFQTTKAGFFTSPDAFVTKLDPAGAMVYSTYLGGSNNEECIDIAVDALQRAFVVGFTYSDDFPVRRAVQPTYGGGGDVFVTRFVPLGSGLGYSTYLGGSSFEWGTGIALDADQNAYVTGLTGSSDFPTTPGVFQPSKGSANDAFVARLDRPGSALVYSTYLGGSQEDYATDIAVDDLGNAYVTGATSSSDFPTVNPYDATLSPSGADAFVAKLDGTGSTLAFSTYLGGANSDVGSSIDLDASNRVFVCGYTVSTDFPTVDAIQPALVDTGFGNFSDAFVSVLNTNTSTLLFSTYLGGGDNESTHYYFHSSFVGPEIAVDGEGTIYTAGYTRSADFPVHNAVQPTNGGGVGDEDGFVAKIIAFPVVPAVVQSYASRWVQGHVEVAWQLADVAGDLTFEIFRAEGAGSAMQVRDAEITRNRDAFVFKDSSVELSRTYDYRVEILEDGRRVASFETQVTTPAGRFALEQNTPNPFNPSTHIAFSVERSERVTLAVYDLQGKHVATLVDERMTPGDYAQGWDGRDAAGHPVASGVYFYRLTQGNRSLTKKMLLLK